MAAVWHFTFLKAKGYEIGASLVDDEKVEYCKEMMEKAEKLGKKLLLPEDAVVAKSFPSPTMQKSKLRFMLQMQSLLT